MAKRKPVARPTIKLPFGSDDGNEARKAVNDYID